MNKPWYLDNYLLRFEENKDHLIDRLDLTDEQKEQLKAFFKKYPNYESKIDWNRKDLTFADFEPLLANEGKSKTQAKKKGLEGIVEGTDYKILDRKSDYIAYQPLTYLGSVTIASNKVPPVKENGAKWCTAYQKTDEYWNSYTKKGIRFCYVCDSKTKYALVLYKGLREECYSFEDRNIECPKKYKYLYEELAKEMASEREERKKLVDKYINTYLPSLWIKEKVAYIPSDCDYKNEITNIAIPDSVTSIGDKAFHCCYNLKNITIPNSVTSIGNYAFSDCINLMNIAIPNSVTSIGDGAFMNCENLTNITIPDLVTSIGWCAFYECRHLEEITVSNSVTSIDVNAFGYCENLKSIAIPDSVTSIGAKAFSGCPKLTIYYQGTEDQWKKIEGSERIEQPVVFEKN